MEKEYAFLLIAYAIIMTVSFYKKCFEVGYWKQKYNNAKNKI